MKLKKISINNYKSIGSIDFDIKKFNGSHTIAFVGINEVGKSNILEAMSFLTPPEEDFDFLNLCNMNNDQSPYVDIYFEMEFKNPDTYKEILKEVLIAPKNCIGDIQIEKITKNVYLKRDETKFNYQYDLSLGELTLNDLFYNETTEEITLKRTNETIKKYEFKKLIELSDEEKEKFKELNLDELKNILNKILDTYFTKYGTKVSFWEPSYKYLITKEINLNDFKNNSSINIPLKNIFSLSGYTSVESIKLKIEEAEKNDRILRRLEKQLSENSTKYINSIWKGHKIKIDIRITEQMNCRVHIKDGGRKNEDKYYSMNDRSQGFKQFMSLILTLSVENEKLNMKDKLILIDEPENHLHPSGIRDLRDELIKIGRENYVFLSTHSNFMIDNKLMERNIIIKKDKNNNTFKKIITNHDDIFDDEVLKDAFGINVFKDFLSPNKILVEGFSDKLILQKAIKKVYPNINFTISNGKGDNLPAVASLLNFQEISPIVILDDDKRGQKNKENIKKIKGVFSESNVFTIRDLEGNIQDKGTIEDLLPRDFVISKFKDIHGKLINNDFIENKDTPIIEELKRFLLKNLDSEKKETIHEVLEKLKIKISEDYDPSNIEKKTPLLFSLIGKIVERLK